MFLLPFSSPNSPTKILKLFPSWSPSSSSSPLLDWRGAQIYPASTVSLVGKESRSPEGSRSFEDAGLGWPPRPTSRRLLPSPRGWIASSTSVLEFHEVAGSRILLQTNPHTQEVHCSRERSRAAWKAIDEYLMPFVEKEKYELPSKCRLHPDNDMFREQEQHKIHFDVNEWRCGFCKKAFRAEKFIDQHFANRHNNLVDNSQGRCLADLCGALHCDLTVEFKKPKSKCNAAAAARNRHRCENLADSCFPINQGHSASRLHEFFLRQFCDAHTCSGGSKPFPKGGRKQTNRFYLALCILTVLLLPLFYLIVFLQQREMRKGVQDLKRISKIGHKKKPS